MSKPLDVVPLLAELVRIPSVNPMGRHVTGDEYLEHAMTARLEQIFRDLQLPFVKQHLAPRRENILAMLPGTAGAGVLVFEAHQDTVPVDGMTIEPWSGEIRDGRVWGRGSCDIKGGMACMIAALSRLAAEKPRDIPTVVIACTVNEEHGYTGASHLANLWQQGSDGLTSGLPSAVIVAEPTELDVVVAHKGVVRWRCRTHGRAAHSSMPQAGENAIYRMTRVIGALENYATEVAPRLPGHPLCGSPTLSVGVISGGISVNTVPASCVIEIDRRVIPGENAMAARQQVIDHIRASVGDVAWIEHDLPYISSNGLKDVNNQAIANRLSEVAAKHGGAGRKVGVPFGTDATAYDEIPVPSVVFGPGNIAQAHTADEWIATDQLEAATEILYQLAKSGSLTSKG